MQVSVNLNALVEAMESQDDEQKTFLNIKTGELILYSHEEFSAPDLNDEENGTSEDTRPDWQKESYDLENSILGSDDCLPLPDLDESHQYHLMEQFCDALIDSPAKDQLLDVLQDDGKYEHFVTTLEANEIADEWLQFRSSAYRAIASEWCEQHHIELGKD